MTNDDDLVDREVVESREAIVAEAYRLISFEPESGPNWERFNALFTDRAVLALRVFPEDESVSIMDLDEYAVKLMRKGMREEGYTETQIQTDWFEFGDIAEARVIFEIRFGDEDPIPALDVFQLVRRDGRWWIVSIIAEIPKAGTEIPSDFLR